MPPVNIQKKKKNFPDLYWILDVITGSDRNPSCDTGPSGAVSCFGSSVCFGRSCQVQGGPRLHLMNVQIGN